MTSPISNDSSRSEPLQHYSDPDSCNPAAESCKSTPSPAPALASSPDEAPPRVITLEPVYIEGGEGARSLVEQHCRGEWKAALLSCGGAVGTAAGAVSTAPAPPLFVGALVGVVVAGEICGENLAALYFCER